MQTLLAILQLAGGWRPGLYLKIDNPPFMELVVEDTGEPGPLGLPAISVAHYGKQNGDLMRDPEMCLEFTTPERTELLAFYWRNDSLGWEQWSRYLRDGLYRVHDALLRQHENFAALWDSNLRAQGYLSAFDPTRHIRA